MTMTTSERVARMLQDDGTKFYTEDGKSLHELATEAGATAEDHPEKHYLTRYAFADGSAIVASENGWDLEGSEPWSWQNDW